MKTSRKIKYINDQILIHILEYGSNAKFASFDTSFFNSVKGYFQNQINPENKIGSLLDLLAPGSLVMTVSRLGFPKLGIFLGIIVSAMGIDLTAIYSSIFNKFKNLIQNNNVTEDNVQTIITSTIDSQDTEISENELKNLQSLPLSVISYDDAKLFHKISSLSDVILIKKFAKSNIKKKTLGILGTILYYFFTAALAAVGVNVAGQAVRKMVGKPNAFDGTLKDPTKMVENTGSQPKQDITQIKSKQSLFTINPNYTDTKYNTSANAWIENYPNTTSGISNMLIDFAKDVYKGLDNLDSKIKSNPSFNTVLNYIEDYNIDSTGDNSVFIPKKYKSKKEVVDQFIDDIAFTVNK